MNVVLQTRTSLGCFGEDGDRVTFNSPGLGRLSCFVNSVENYVRPPPQAELAPLQPQAARGVLRPGRRACSAPALAPALRPHRHRAARRARSAAPAISVSDARDAPSSILSAPEPERGDDRDIDALRAGLGHESRRLAHQVRADAPCSRDQLRMRRHRAHDAFRRCRRAGASPRGSANCAMARASAVSDSAKFGTVQPSTP